MSYRAYYDGKKMDLTIAIHGGRGKGKTTLATLLSEYLKACGMEVEVSDHDGRTEAAVQQGKNLPVELDPRSVLIEVQN